MAVSETFGGKSVRIKYDCGLDDNGKTIMSSKTYSNLKEGATNDAIKGVTDVIVGLQQHDEHEVCVIDSTILN